MPLFKYLCDCGYSRRFIRDAEPDSVECARCHAGMRRDFQPPTSAIKEVLDNGWMTKKLERYADPAELYKNREKKADQ